jgi:hypothetical protein
MTSTGERGRRLGKKRKKWPREYRVILTSDAVVKTTYLIRADSAAEAVAIARSGEVPPDDEETTEQRDRYCEVDGEEHDL